CCCPIMANHFIHLNANRRLGRLINMIKLKRKRSPQRHHPQSLRALPPALPNLDEMDEEPPEPTPPQYEQWKQEQANYGYPVPDIVIEKQPIQKPGNPFDLPLSGNPFDPPPRPTTQPPSSKIFLQRFRKTHPPPSIPIVQPPPPKALQRSKRVHSH